MKVNPYLNYGGNCEEAFRFYEKNIGAQVTFLMTFDQAPGPAPNVPDNWKKKVLYAHMLIGQSEIMGSDAPADRFQPMRSVYLSLAVDSNEEAERIHALFSQGGEIFMPMQETFFAYRFSMLRDKFGTSWMIIHSRPAPPQA
jgi:PhnB protein